MAISEREINQLKEQLREAKAEVRESYEKLVDAGVAPLPDDFFESVAGGVTMCPSITTPFPTGVYGTTNPTNPRA